MLRTMMGEEHKGLRVKLINGMGGRLNALDKKIATELQNEARSREALATKVEETNTMVQDLMDRLEQLEVQDTTSTKDVSASSTAGTTETRQGPPMDPGHDGRRRLATTPQRRGSLVFRSCSTSSLQTFGTTFPGRPYDQGPFFESALNLRQRQREHISSWR